MADHIISAGDFFSFSPEVHIRRNPAVEDTVREAMIWIDQHPEKGGQKNCQVYLSSDEERRGHLVRLKGVKKIHDVLLELGDELNYDLFYHKMKKGWEVPHNEHPCGMLSFSYKWWMTSSDKCRLGRYGPRRKAEESCVPLEMRGEQWHRFSVQHCQYCNGTYERTIQLA